ncbi:hypothetical protein CLAIMM_05265 [Cladophialophora immunda]|nr:hypothetical protein CLAIMM_05265 [Cladophialophora immunda]
MGIDQRRKTQRKIFWQRFSAGYQRTFFVSLEARCMLLMRAVPMQGDQIGGAEELLLATFARGTSPPIYFATAPLVPQYSVAVVSFVVIREDHLVVPPLDSPMCLR